MPVSSGRASTAITVIDGNISAESISGFLECTEVYEALGTRRPRVKTRRWLCILNTCV